MMGFMRRPDPVILHGPVLRDPGLGPLGPAEELLDIVEECRNLRDRLIVW